MVDVSVRQNNVRSEDQGGDQVDTAGDEERENHAETTAVVTRCGKSFIGSRCTQEEDDHHGQEKIPFTEKVVETDDGERRSPRCESTVATSAVWTDGCGSAMWKYECEYDFENVDRKRNTGVEKDRSISTSCGQLLTSLKWRDRCHNESEATIDIE